MADPMALRKKQKQEKAFFACSLTKVGVSPQCDSPILSATLSPSVSSSSANFGEKKEDAAVTPVRPNAIPNVENAEGGTSNSGTAEAAHDNTHPTGRWKCDFNHGLGPDGVVVVPEPEHLVLRLRGGGGNSPSHESGTEGAQSPDNGTEGNNSSESEDATAGPSRCLPCAPSGDNIPVVSALAPPSGFPGGGWFCVSGRPIRDRRCHAPRP